MVMPLGELLAIFEFWIQNIDWATKNMEMLETNNIKMKMFRELWDRSNLGLSVQNSIPEINSMLKSKGPKCSVCSFGPVNGKMKQHCTGHVKDHLKGTFSKFLMMGTHAGEMKGLFLVCAISLPSNTSKGLIVCYILFDLHANRGRKGLKCMFRKDRLCRSSRKLMKIKDKFGGMVNKNSASCIFFVTGFLTNSVG